MPASERPWVQLPKVILVGFILLLGLQIYSHRQQTTEHAGEYRPLTSPFDETTYSALAAGSQKLFSYLLIIRLQLHDNQAGRHIRYQLIDYDLLLEWLEVITRLNTESEYPMLLATRVYSQTTDKNQLRKLLYYIDNTFMKNPQLFWRNQAEATVIAKHKLGDLKLALALAENISRVPETKAIPQWARDLHFLLLADLNEYESSIAIIQAMLQTDSVQDPDQKRFLKQKLLYFQQKLSEFRRYGNDG